MNRRVSTVDSSIYRDVIRRQRTKTSTVQASLGISVTARRRMQMAANKLRNKDLWVPGIFGIFGILILILILILVFLDFSGFEFLFEFNLGILILIPCNMIGGIRLAKTALGLFYYLLLLCTSA